MPTSSSLSPVSRSRVTSIADLSDASPAPPSREISSPSAPRSFASSSDDEPRAPLGGQEPVDDLALKPGRALAVQLAQRDREVGHRVVAVDAGLAPHRAGAEGGPLDVHHRVAFVAPRLGRVNPAHREDQLRAAARLDAGEVFAVAASDHAGDR